MALIRIFKTREEAEFAKKVLNDGKIEAEVIEDKFNNVSIAEFGVRARFRVVVADEDYDKAALFIAGKLPRKIRP